MRDLRGYLKQIEEMGELRVITGAHWDSEIGQITELLFHQDSSPAVLFDYIPGGPKGFRVLVNSLGSFKSKRLGLCLGIPSEDRGIDFIKSWRRRSKEIKRVEPKFVTDGPILENVEDGDEVDLLKFPTPKWHPLDGGRYIGTGSVTITRDPDEGWVNLGTYRVMVHDRNTLGFYLSPGTHASIQREKYRARGEIRELLTIDDYLPKGLFAQILFSSRSFLEAKPDVVRKVVKGYLLGADYVMKNQDWAIRRMMTEMRFSEEAAKIAYPKLHYTDGRIDLKRIDAAVNFLVEYGLLAKDKIPPMDKIFAKGFVE